MTATQTGSGDDLHLRLRAQRESFGRRAPLSYAERVDALDALLAGVLRYEDAFVASLIADFGHRAPQETRLLEVFPVVDEIRHSRRHLRGWMRARSAATNWQFSPSRSRIIHQPLGVVGIIGAWNYQILLTLSPLVNVLAAGNHAMIKPSELAPATAEAIRQMIAETFPPDYVAVVTGGPDISAAFSALPFDHIIFTGSGRVGKLVMRAAAENLTPVTLELGGKSPALVHDEFPLALAADRICAGKFWNAGQTCVAPDYALVPAATAPAFLQAARESVSRRLPKIAANPDYTHMLNRAGWERMAALVEDAKAKGANVVQINPAGEDCNAENRVFPPTLIAGASDSMRVMQEEIFGPILPIVTHDSLADGIQFINRRPRPLALYYFDYDGTRVSQVLEQTTSGGVTVNDCIFHLPQNNLPFGGVGPSGMGAYHGFDGFETFSKKKGVFMQSRLTGWFLARFLKPPYTRWSDLVISLMIWSRRQRGGAPREARGS